MSEILAVDGVSKSFGSKVVLKDISFSVSKGEFLSILGPSGCGKTTLLRIIIGLLPPSSGKVYKDSQEITHLPPNKRNIGIVFQNYALFHNMTVYGNVEYALRINPRTKANARKLALEAIHQVNLDEHMNKKPAKLSGGQQQRVAIARTLALNPDIILLDEPLSALDADTRLLLRAELKRIQNESGATMIYITHDQEEAFAMSDRIMVMDSGVIQQLDTPEAIVEHPQNKYVESFVVNNLKIKLKSLIRYVELN